MAFKKQKTPAWDAKANAALTCLVSDFPGTGLQALYAVHAGDASQIQIEILSHPSRALATSDGVLTELGIKTLEHAHSKIQTWLSLDGGAKIPPK